MCHCYNENYNNCNISQHFCFVQGIHNYYIEYI